MSVVLDRAAFAQALIRWLNEHLLPPGVTVDSDTPLFSTGLINSIRVLELIAWTEKATGRVIPDRMILMDHFRSVRRITDVFLVDEEDWHG